MKSPLFSLPLVAVLLVSLANAEDFTGTWKVNPGKSKFGSDVMKTISIEQSGPNTLHVTFDGIRKDGTNLHQELIQTCDGKGHPRSVIGAKAGGYTDACQPTSPTTIKVINKQNGKVTSENTFKLSNGGKVLTHLQTGRGAHRWFAER